MLYAIFARDSEDTLGKRQTTRRAHVERLRKMQDEGRLMLAGPFPAVDAPDLSAGARGSLIVAEFESLEAARSWAQADPYVAAGIYAEVDVQPFVKTFPQ